MSTLNNTSNLINGSLSFENINNSTNNYINATNSFNSTNGTSSSAGISDLNPFTSLILGGVLQTLSNALVDTIIEQANDDTINGINWNSFNTFLTYSCSLYGLTCLLMALILNRTIVLASSNRNHHPRLAPNNNARIRFPRLVEYFKQITIICLRALAISVLLYNMYNVLIALNLLNYTADRPDELLWVTKNLSNAWLEYDPASYTNNSYMMQQSNDALIGPTSNMYWPIYLGFCLLVFTETFVSTIQGAKIYSDTSMTLFELSVSLHQSSSTGLFFGHETRLPNEPTLVLCLFQIFSHLNVHVGNLINKNKYRLIPLTILNLGFISYFIHCIFNLKIYEIPGFVTMTMIPQLLILLVIFVSACIFGLAILSNGFDIGQLRFGSLFLAADRDEAESRANRFNFTLEDDFLTALIGFGELAVIQAGRSSYITELRLVISRSDTWVERSVWEALQWQPENNMNTHRDKLLTYLKENKICGYANLITNPSKRLITGEKITTPSDKSSTSLKSKATLLRKMLNFYEIYVSLFQLIEGLVVRKFIVTYIPFWFKKHILRKSINLESHDEDESEKDFERRKNSVPKFLRKFVTRSKHQVTSHSSERVVLDEFSDEQLRTEYVALLKGPDISDNDKSETYQPKRYELDSESDLSDVELIENTSDLGFRSRMVPQDPAVLPINELFTPDLIKEFIETTHGNTVLYHHLNYNYEEGGIMTRSKYKRLTDSVFDQDETSKLVDLILSKRIDSKRQTSDEDIDDLSVDSRFDCVICQTNSREIITWPCRCFAICESCRLSLVSKGIEGCVCCRRDVEGVSKVFIP